MGRVRRERGSTGTTMGGEERERERKRERRELAMRETRSRLERRKEKRGDAPI